MFSGQSLQTEFRLLTSVSHTSQPVGWEEISARRQDVIDKAVALLQECYQFTTTRRGSDMTEYLISAPVMLAGEDVPIQSLLGKVVRSDITKKKGPMMPENLPRFPVREWLEYLSKLSREQVNQVYQKAREYAIEKSCGHKDDDGANRMAGNYAFILMSWRFLCDFAGIDISTGSFTPSVLKEMNAHIKETHSDREPWVWIMEVIAGEIDANNFRYPYVFDEAEDGEPCLYIRATNMMQHFSQTPALKDKFNALPVKSATVLKKQLNRAGIIHEFDKERSINRKRSAHLLGLSLRKLEEYGVVLSAPDNSIANLHAA